MGLRKDWAEWWRRFFSSSANEDGQVTVNILRQRYLEEMQQRNRFRQHAQEMHYPQFREKLLCLATDKDQHAQWIAEKIVRLGGKLPEVPEHRATEENSWKHLMMDLQEENRCADHLWEQLWRIGASHSDVTELLRKIYEAEKKHRYAIREMLMRSDPFALSNT